MEERERDVWVWWNENLWGRWAVKGRADDGETSVLG